MLSSATPQYHRMLHRTIRNRSVLCTVLLVLALLPACKRIPEGNTQTTEGSYTPSNKPLVNYIPKVIAEYPHDETAFTQGLVWLGNNTFLESTGQYGRSDIRLVTAQTGAVLQRRGVEPQFFAEGCCVLNGKIYQITWNEQTCFVYDSASLRPISQFTYRGEGWGITTDGFSLIMSNGSSFISFINPNTFEVQRSIDVTMGGLQKVRNLNELEYINGKIYANIWLTDSIVIIDPRTGNVEGILDCTGLLPASLRRPGTDVLNGIAYNAQTGRVYLTGKYWPLSLIHI